ncbi:MAG: DUF2851 family protein [Chthoniobacterales bacterium]
MSKILRTYREALSADRSLRVQERDEPADELAWQARWFSGACGRDFTSNSGEKVVIRDFGEWNREAGPDFVRCSVRVADRERHGAIEVDLDAAGWEQHRHAVNPDYENVVLHVVVRRPTKPHFSRTARHREVPQVCLADGQRAEDVWSATAPARPGRCSAPLRELPSDQLTELLKVAARRRLERKGAVLDTMIAARGADAALYEAVAATLGYKNNKLPFQLLAQRVPWREAARPRGEALLFGLAGFLDKPEPPAGAPRQYAADLWAAWWKERAARTAAILPSNSWRLAGQRPANHPLRRLGALAAVARQWRQIRPALEAGNEARLQAVLGRLTHPFWSFHTTWRSPHRPAPLALLGPDRIREIFANIALPLALARGISPAWEDFPSGPSNTALRVVSARLFGGPLPRTLPRRLFVDQGLLQIYADFCLRDHGECAHCRFPALVTRLT